VFVEGSIPYIDVIERMRRIREFPRGNAISLVALSTSHVESASLLGFDGLLTKPARFEALLDLLEKLTLS
jgi:CheY-like chemotaxis protein